MDNLENFKKVEKIGQGTFGTVCMEYIDKAIFLPSGQVFALKFVKLDNKGVKLR
jgi:hypothetical protein